MKKPYIKCPKCVGHGKILIPSILWESFQIIQKAKGTITVEQVYKEFKQSGIGITAINNRFRTLERNGFIKRQGKRGKNWLWKKA